MAPPVENKNYFAFVITRQLSTEVKRSKRDFISGEKKNDELMKEQRRTSKSLVSTMLLFFLVFFFRDDRPEMITSITGEYAVPVVVKFESL